MNFDNALNEIKITQFAKLYKEKHPKIMDKGMVVNLLDDEGAPLTSKDAEERLSKMGITISPELKSFIRDLTAEANAVVDYNAEKRAKNAEIKSRLKGKPIARSRNYGLAT